MKKAVTAIFVAAAVIVTASCGNNPPEIKQIHSQMNFILEPGGELPSAELTVMFNADDEDGDDDIEVLNIYNDRNQMLWTVDSGSWSTRSGRGITWKGSARFSTIDGSLPPPGEYRLEICDRAGEREEDTIYLKLIKNVPAAEDFPELIFDEKSDSGFEIKSPDTHNLISFYDEEEKLLSAYAATPGRVEIKKLRDGNSVYKNYRSIKISYYSNSVGAGLVCGPYLRN